MTDSFNDHLRDAVDAHVPGAPWSHPSTARRTIVAAARRCIASAISNRLPDDARAGDLFVSDETFRQLHGCVSEYAHAVAALGDDPARALRLILSAVADAAAPHEPHPALLRAVEEWFGEATTGRHD